MKTKILGMCCLLLSSLSIANETIKNDFQSSAGKWFSIQSKDHKGEQRLLKINENSENQIYLYHMAPGAETAVQTHKQFEEVIIAEGSLYWLKPDKSILKKLEVGAYVDRKPNVPHGPFKAGPNGCLMYVRFH